jgi:hypothetical protein
MAVSVALVVKRRQALRALVALVATVAPVVRAAVVSRFR